MKRWRRACAGCFAVALALSTALPARGQRPDESVAEREGRMARRGGGVRVGAWNVDDPSRADARFSRSLQFELFLQRGLDERLVLENSAAVWRRLTRERQAIPAASDTVETRSYIIPLLTSLKYFPFTGPGSRLEPFILGGLGFAVGIEDQSQNALGGGGTTIVTGFGVKAAAGIEVRIGSLGVAGDARYQWMKLSDELGLESTFGGAGLEGGLTFRFRY